MATDVSSVVIKAPAFEVWSALTKPELVKQWQYGSHVVTDWRVGSSITFHSEWQGTVYEQWGTILEVAPNKLIKYSLFAPRPDLQDKPENYFVMSYELAERDGSTTLTVIQQDDRPGSQPQQSVDSEGQPSVLDMLKSLVEQRSP